MIAKTLFYGKNDSHSDHNNKLMKKIHRKAENFRKKPLPLPLKSRIYGLPTTWKVFKRQSEALEFANQTPELMVFSHEERIPDGNGKRLFLVTHPQQLWKIYMDRSVEERCTYEVIRENAKCKLYFDLEFSYVCNPNHDGSRMVGTFKTIIISFILNCFDIRIDERNILDLESSTKEKFSRHLIVILPESIFQDNYNVGNFVRSLCLCLREHMFQDQVSENASFPVDKDLIKELFVKNKDDKLLLFVDEGVYTKNRNFRILLSSKFGKNTPLVVSKDNRFMPNTYGGICSAEEKIFLDSLITYMGCETNLKVLSYTCSKDVGRKNLHTGSSSSVLEKFGSNNCPYPEISSFIQNLVTSNNNSAGYISKWTYFHTTELIVFDIRNYRFCENIRRSHKSNGVMFIVNIPRLVYYQKCYDPECRNYKSQEKPLPKELVAPYLCEESYNEISCLRTNNSGFEGDDFMSFLEQSLMKQEEDSAIKTPLPLKEDYFDNDEIDDGTLVSVLDVVENLNLSMM